MLLSDAPAFRRAGEERRYVAKARRVLHTLARYLEPKETKRMPKFMQKIYSVHRPAQSTEYTDIARYAEMYSVERHRSSLRAYFEELLQGVQARPNRTRLPPGLCMLPLLIATGEYLVTLS